MTPSTISAGFLKCGAYPLNSDAVDCSIRVRNSEKGNDEDQLSEKTLAKEKIIKGHSKAQQPRLISEQSNK